MGKRHRLPAPVGIGGHFNFSECFHFHRNFDVPQLTEKIVQSHSRLGPAEKRIAKWLDNSISVYNSLAMIWVCAFPCKRFKYRWPCLFYLQEKSVSVICHEQQYPTCCTYASDPDDFDCCILKFVTLKKETINRGQGLFIKFKCFPHCICDITGCMSLNV